MVVVDNNLTGNYNGLSFFNYLSSQTCSAHTVAGNTISHSSSVGVNVGSLVSSTVGFHPTTDSYVLGNTLYNNSIIHKVVNTKYGFNANGPAFGIVMIANNSTQGLSLQMLSRLKGGLIVPDPL